MKKTLSLYTYHEEVVEFPKEVHHSEQLFSIVSWGCAGTSWLSKVFNSHPDILCLHDFLIGLFDISKRDPLKYMQAIYLTSYSYVLAGDVHGIPRDAIPDLKRIYGTSFESTVLVRDPYPRLLSMLATVRFNHGLDNDYSYIDDLVKRLDIDIEMTWDNRMFIHSVNMLNAIIDEKKYVGDTIFKIEDLTTDIEKLNQLITYISSGKVKPDERWLTKAITIPPVHSHRKHFGKEITLTRREKDLITLILSKEAVDEYEKLGYDLSTLIVS